ncbi:hypothetical protein RFI_03111 [Reticulomyxa filosa]|uniref:Uncharacterized protein n=1 Tax=Reticulomyxa filosa TaxID=46433 RepID=X6P8L1_RETFI|nr:hypothetical protein RFI_03111 [Reticulomyxa filosa]|eukprot:ETO33987.1 hypothetical protein RFI_03111 [Reticulomyxa filosa]
MIMNSQLPPKKHNKKKKGLDEIEIIKLFNVNSETRLFNCAINKLKLLIAQTMLMIQVLIFKFSLSLDNKNFSKKFCVTFFFISSLLLKKNVHYFSSEKFNNKSAIFKRI